jgi:hypothetical protein
MYSATFKGRVIGVAVVWIGREANIRRRDGTPHLLVGGEATELDVIVQAKLGCEATKVLKHRPTTDESGVPVLPTSQQMGERAQCVVDTILRAHDPNVDEQMFPSSRKRRIVWKRGKQIEHRPVADDGDIVRRHSAPVDGDTPDRITGHEDDIGKAKRRPLE